MFASLSQSARAKKPEIGGVYYVDVGPAEPDFISLSFRTVPEKCEEARGKNLSACNTSYGCYNIR